MFCSQAGWMSDVFSQFEANRSERKEKLQRNEQGEGGRWDEIKRGKATRLKGNAGHGTESNELDDYSRRHLYSREIVIDRSEDSNDLRRVVADPFLSSFPVRSARYRLSFQSCTRGTTTRISFVPTSFSLSLSFMIFNPL